MQRINQRGQFCARLACNLTEVKVFYFWQETKIRHFMLPSPLFCPSLQEQLRVSYGCLFYDEAFPRPSCAH